MRYLGRKWPGPSGEILYPAHDDPELSYEIDSLMAIYEDLGSKIGPMNLPMHPEYKNKDEHFL